MKLYHLNKIKEVFKKANSTISRKSLEEFFCTKNAYDNLSINTFYASTTIEDAYYLSEDDLRRISLIATVKFQGDFDVDKLDFVELDDSIRSYNTTSFATYIEKVIEHRKKPEISQIVYERKNLKKEIALEKKPHANINFDFSTQKLVSIDFEYKAKKNYIPYTNCFEFGITTHINGKSKSSHYIIDDYSIFKGKYRHKLEKKFRDGTSEHVSVSQISGIILEALKDADYLVLQGASNELKILKDNNLVLPENIKILDTQKIKEIHFNKLFAGSSLKSIMHGFNMRTPNLHNSGNDAAYTMKVFLKMHELFKLENTFENKETLVSKPKQKQVF